MNTIASALQPNKHDTVAYELSYGSVEVHLFEGSAEKYIAKSVTKEFLLRARARRLEKQAVAALVGAILALALFVYLVVSQAPGNFLLAYVFSSVAVFVIMGIAHQLRDDARDTLRHADKVLHDRQDGEITRAQLTVNGGPTGETAAQILTDRITPKMRDKLIAIVRRDGEVSGPVNVMLVLREDLEPIAHKLNHEAARERAKEIRALHREATQ